MSEAKRRVPRRKLLLYGAAGLTAGAAAVAGGLALYRRRSIAGAPIVEDRPGLADPKAVVSERRRLGRTGLEISVVGIGAGALAGPEPIVRAVDKGMNYIDTAICYGDSEKVIRRALKSSPGLRDKLVIATKWDPGVSSTKDEILASLDKSLGRLGVDHVDSFNRETCPLPSAGPRRASAASAAAPPLPMAWTPLAGSEMRACDSGEIFQGPRAVSTFDRATRVT